jgi:hypothetical protein
MAIIKKIDRQHRNNIIIEDLGDKAALVKEDQLRLLEQAVKTVCFYLPVSKTTSLTWLQVIQEKVPNPKDSDDEA